MSTSKDLHKKAPRSVEKRKNVHDFYNRRFSNRKCSQFDVPRSAHHYPSKVVDAESSPTPVGKIMK